MKQLLNLIWFCKLATLIIMVICIVVAFAGVAMCIAGIVRGG